MRVAVGGVLAVLLAACADDACVHDASSRYYDEALSRRLVANGVAHSVHSERGVCLSADRKPQLVAAQREIDTYFPEVAELLGDECEERAFVAWATRENLRFEVVDAKSSSGPARMILIRSFSSDEAAANRKKLAAQAPKNARCAK